jgi:hypothetical protein
MGAIKMTDFKVNDFVRIIRKSKTINTHIHNVGLSGYIEEICGEFAQFVELREDGLGGQGGVPMDCLELANGDTRLQALKKAKDDKYEKLYQETKERTKRYIKERDEAISHAMAATGVSAEAIERIIEIYDEFESEWQYK